ncbi:hypothetical protein BDV23DRAFT_189285 [Aspergillus alliaceus]|uniref:Uncharacterized protein n=1 Tax=Petromyces alliaceus TaxID=209559 RepID=A0A5N7BRB7_PETAA|nr:hypothetical protein BDV23DRAFT_189285 [Aspergillus alliaceus]
MQSSRQAAEDNIALLTGKIGPLPTTSYKIAAFTPELKAKREDIKDKISHIHFTLQWDPKLNLDGFTTLIKMAFDRSALAQFIQFGYQENESTTKAKGITDYVNKDYIIDQLTMCADKLESLAEALGTNRDNTIHLDDPGALENVIPEEERKEISKALDDYVDTVLTRSDAVIEYNTSIQHLLDSSQTLNHCNDQIDKLGHQAIKIDPELPSVIFLLRKMQDLLRLRAELEALFNGTLEFYSRNVRDIWPANPDILGLVYGLRAERRQLMTPSSPGDYTAFVSVDPEKTRDVFRDWIYIRLQEVHVWLFGVEIPKPDPAGRRLLSIHITHQGDESITDTHNKRYNFSHDPLNVQFVNDTVEATSI